MRIGPPRMDRLDTMDSTGRNESLHPEKMSEEMKEAIDLQKVSASDANKSNTLTAQSQDTEEVYLASFDVQRANSEDT